MQSQNWPLTTEKFAKPKKNSKVIGFGLPAKVLPTLQHASNPFLVQEYH